jgi:CRP/FNR family cyclic AMP-dependent transcriptional regulator
VLKGRATGLDHFRFCELSVEGRETARLATIARHKPVSKLSGQSGWLGEGSVLKRELRPYEVVTLRDSWIALMPMKTFDWLFETSLAFNHFLVHQLNARLGQFVAVVESCRMQSTTAQVAVCVAEPFNPALCSATSDALRISQEEIARLCGLSRQIANRALHELQAAGIIRMQYGSIHVLDVEGLHAFGRGAGLRQDAPRPVAVVVRPH